MRQLVAAGPHRLRKQWLARWRSFSTRSLEERDRSRCNSAHRGGLELSTGTGLYVCVSVDPVLSGCVV